MGRLSSVLLAIGLLGRVTALGLAAGTRPLAFSVAPAPDAVVAPIASPRGVGHIVALAGQKWLRI